LLGQRGRERRHARGIGARLGQNNRFRLDRGERRTLLTHELAHYRRRDHWVRWIELAATLLFWWDPVCWWARREMRDAEEQCCDAWVLWALPHALRQYAGALLQTVEFVSAPLNTAPVRLPVPALASGMGQFSHLKRRFIMLKRANIARALTGRGTLAVLAAGALLLPVMPTLGGPPAALIGVLTIAVGWVRWREERHYLLQNLVAYA